MEIVKDMARQLASPPSNKSLRAWFVNQTSLKDLAKLEITNPTKTFEGLVERALKLERQTAKSKKQSRESSSSSNSTSNSLESLDSKESFERTSYKVDTKNLKRYIKA